MLAHVNIFIWCTERAASHNAGNIETFNVVDALLISMRNRLTTHYDVTISNFQYPPHSPNNIFLHKCLKYAYFLYSIKESYLHNWGSLQQQIYWSLVKNFFSSTHREDRNFSSKRTLLILVRNEWRKRIKRPALHYTDYWEISRTRVLLSLWHAIIFTNYIRIIIIYKIFWNLPRNFS